MAAWLPKTEASTYSFTHLVKDEQTYMRHMMGEGL